MLNSMYIADTSPYGEDCVCVGEDDYLSRAKEECTRFLAQIRKHYGKEPGGSYLDIKKNAHDFGYYLSVEFYYDTDSVEEGTYGFDVEGDVNDALEFWDKEFAE
jgi:hypothetical protein